MAGEKASGSVTGTYWFETYRHTKGDGSYTIRDFDDTGYPSGLQNDKLVFTDVASNEIEISLEGDFLVIRLDNDETVKIYRASDSNYAIEAIEFSDGVTTSSQALWATAFSQGTDGDDTLTGRDAGDIYFGYGGNDTIDGGAGNDTQYGGEGDDLIIGNIGGDAFFGGADFDKLDFTYTSQ